MMVLSEIRGITMMENNLLVPK